VRTAHAPGGAGAVRTFEPVLLLVPISAAVALLFAVRPIVDVDAFWHVVIGDEIRATATIRNLGSDWAWFDPQTPWTTSQWLSEVGMSWLVREFGWGTLVVATAVVASIAVALLAYVIFTRATHRVGSILFAGVVLGLASTFQARPALLSLCAVLIVGHVAERLLQSGRTPRWWLAAPAAAFWANFHGLWVIAPAAVGLASVAYWIGRPRDRRSSLVRGLVVAAVMTVAGCLTPLGFRGLVLPFEVSAAARAVSEWQPTELWSPVSFELVVVLVVLVAAWARSHPIPAGELLYAGALVGFGLIAVRNAPVATALLVPLTATRASAAFPSARTPSPKESRAVAASALILAALGAVIVAVSLARVDPLAQARALDLSQKLKGQGPLVVLNDYNAAGALVAFGPSDIQLAIDGRTDRYGSEYIDEYLRAVEVRGPEWRAYVDRLDPDAAVLEADAAIVQMLQSELGWRVTAKDGEYVLLEPDA
jgi:hypothetical protein